MSSITKETTLNAQDAETYATKAKELLQGQLSQNYNDIEESATKDLVDRTEENLVNMLYLMLNVSLITQPLPINKDNISMTVFKSSGGSLPSSYNTNYGELTLPYWETFQDSNKDQECFAECKCTYNDIR
ncbi:hypothetical protein KUTeg_022978 [Tegillarca granosa]|uniref:Uncharacterized protein n=1 Tax=Tegillarca granosa TaxID=220873 RepID=A0ABQ9E6J7_TEGGR|nr:hypothetical protein KUTeg_022978 [Tegillarca granosa]